MDTEIYVAISSSFFHDCEVLRQILGSHLRVLFGYDFRGANLLQIAMYVDYVFIYPNTFTPECCSYLHML